MPIATAIAWIVWIGWQAYRLLALPFTLLGIGVALGLHFAGIALIRTALALSKLNEAAFDSAALGQWIALRLFLQEMPPEEWERLERCIAERERQDAEEMEQMQTRKQERKRAKQDQVTEDGSDA